MLAKDELRIKAKNIRKNLDIESISSSIRKNLFELEEYKKSSNIFCYYSFEDEVITQGFFDDESKNWYIPKIDKDDLLICKFDKNNLVKSKFGVLEPASESLELINNETKIDLVILPALMLDKQGHRLGYGKGYYDRFLNSLNYAPLSISLIPEALLKNSLPSEPHDYRCNIIVTEKNIYRV